MLISFAEKSHVLRSLLGATKAKKNEVLVNCYNIAQLHVVWGFISYCCWWCYCDNPI